MQILLALCALLAVSTARVVITAEGPQNLHLLGEEECTWGPSYWCENIKTAAGCNATKHCIKTIWTEMKVPEDNDSVCGICKDMVQQARDQLQSNQTQNDLKAVFEGSCKLIHIKTIVKECITIVDEFIPDLVETLASQMNPSVVCSVAGLCNSARIDKLLEESTTKVDEIKAHSLENDELEPDECTKCYTVAAHMEYKLKNTPRDKMLQQMLNLCSDLSSFTDACSATILTYFDTISTHLLQNFNSENICHLSGQCSAKFHKHEDTDKTPKVEITPLSSVGMVDVSDDLPCKLCEQLVGHLRDILITNTTESEFHQVLNGLCKQTKSFASECTAIVDEYYPEIYEYLTNELDSNVVCQMSGMCPAPGKAIQNQPIWPLVPKSAAEIGMRIFQESKKLESEKHEELSKSEVEAMQLPIERMMPFPISETPLGVKGKQSCALCEYILHYIQESITDPVTENKAKQVVEKVCKKLPGFIRGECSEFIDTYGDALVAILAQEIDPSQVCPMLHFCPSENLMALWESVPTKNKLEEEKNKPGCPLCLLAVSQVYSVIKNNKTETNIEAALDKLCVHLPQSLSEECTDLVKGYSKELIELLLADLSPQEVCVYIKLCNAMRNPGPRNEFITDKSGEILTNEIPNDSDSSEIWEEEEKGVTCVVCEFAMKHLEKAIGSDKAKNKVEGAVHGVCKHLPKTISRPCNKFVNKYASAIVDFIVKNVSPHEICSLLKLCTFYEAEELKASVTECAVCKGAISIIHKLLADSTVDKDIKNVVSKACKHLPSNQQQKCAAMIQIYGQSIINLIKQHTDPKKMCSKMGLCAPADYSAVSLEGSRIKRSYEKTRIKHCTWGPVYWCSTNETALECKAVEHCKEHVWKADFAPPKQITLSETEPNA